MLENFIYSKKKSSFESALNNEEVLDGAIAFIEDTKQIWTRGTYFDCSAIDPKIIDSVNQFLEHKEHFPKIKATTSIPNNDILSEEFQIYRLEKDLEITNPDLFNTLDKFTEGDLYLRGKIDTIGESTPTYENPCMSGLVNGTKINIVFKNGEYDLGVNEDGYVRTTLRTVEPVWEVVASGSNFKLKHINSGQWLYYGDNSLYELSSIEATEFNTKVKNSSEKLYELQRVGASQCINMSKGSGLNYNIGEYTSGDQNNALYIINSSKYKLPNLSTESVYTIRFTSNGSYGYRINGSNVIVGNSYSKLSLVGTYNKLALFFNESYLYLNSSNYLVTSSTEKTYFRLVPKSIQSNRDFEFVIIGNETKSLNAFQGLTIGNNISIWNKGDSNNSVYFTKVGESGVLINRIITNKPATALRDGLMSSEDKQTLNQLYYSNKRNLIDIDKSTRSDKITLLGKYQNSNEWKDLVELNTATTGASGLLSAADKTKLDSFQSANTYATKEQVNSINQVSWSILEDPYNGYEYVDLGLPSGTLWAKCNIGAEKESDYGLYFAWGETVGYKDASSGKIFNWSDYKYCNGSNKTLTKYNTNSSFGIVDNLTTLKLSDDAVYVNMGGSWRMPSYEEYNELINNTTNTQTTVNGVNGWLFTGNNGNTLFFPASGTCENGSVNVVSSYGNYWGSSLSSSNPVCAYSLYFGSDTCYTAGDIRSDGHTVRGVINLNN